MDGRVETAGELGMTGNQISIGGPDGAILASLLYNLFGKQVLARQIHGGLLIRDWTVDTKRCKRETVIGFIESVYDRPEELIGRTVIISWATGKVEYLKIKQIIPDVSPVVLVEDQNGKVFILQLGTLFKNDPLVKVSD